MVVVFVVVGFVFVPNMYIPVVSGIRDNVFCFYRGIYKKNPSGAVLPRDLVLKWAASYSPALHCSTIGAIGLNFSVRNGKRWNTDAIATQRGLTLLTGKM